MWVVGRLAFAVQLGGSAAIESGANSVALVDAINRAQEEREAARKELEQLPSGRTLDIAEVHAMVDYLGDVGAAMDRANPVEFQELYEALRLELVFDHEAKAVDVTVRPAGRGSARVRGGT